MISVRYFVFLLFLAVTAYGAPASQVFGLDFSPYIDGQDPNFNPQVSPAQILARLQLIQPYTNWVRTYSMTTGLEQIPPIAHSLGLKVASGAWISKNLAQNAAELSNLIAAAQAGQVDVAIVGSEALLRGDVTESQLLAYINEVRQAVPASIPVATADTYDTLLAHPVVIAAGDVVLPNIFPYWEGTAISNAICSLAASYQKLVAAVQGKPVIISEAGWPSGGNSLGAAVPSPDNAALFFSQFVSWAAASGVQYYYFTSLDETWKQNYEGPQGAHWGILDKTGVLKPGMQPVFSGQTVPVSCNSVPGGPGSPSIQFTYVPPYGTSNMLEGQALHVAVANYRVATYLFVGGGWWVKPFSNQPLTTIQQDGSFRTPVVTGGVDSFATQYAVFLVPATYSPPILLGAALPAELNQNSVAIAQVSRTTNSISGSVTDVLGLPIPGVAVIMSGGDTGNTTTAPDGLYSFPSIASASSHTIAASYGGYQFTPPSLTIGNISGSVAVNFTGATSADLSVESALSAYTVTTGSTVTGTVVAANQGPGPSSNATVTIALPSSFTGLSVSTTRGSCTTTTPVTCSLGGLPRSATANITFQAKAPTNGTYQIVSSISGPEPDLAPANNTQTVILTVSPPVGVSPPAVAAQITAKSGTSSARTWQIRLTNSGKGAANSTQITALSFTEVAGASCPPVVATIFPVNVGDLAASGGTGTAQVTSDFSSCPLNARFTVLIKFVANSGVYTGSATIYNQFQ